MRFEYGFTLFVSIYDVTVAVTASRFNIQRLDSSFHIPVKETLTSSICNRLQKEIRI